MQQNSNNRSFKIITVIALCVAVLCLSVAYAALTQNLSIEGTAEVQAATWKVKMENFTPATGGNLTYTSNETTISDLAVTFTKPGESQTLSFDITNDGSIDAVLSSITGLDSGLTCSSETATSADDIKKVCGESNNGVGGTVTYKVTYDGVALTNGTTGLDEKLALNSKDTKKVSITVTYDKELVNADNLPEGNVKVTLPTLVFNYNQAD